MSLYVAIRDVNVQSMLARTAASYLSKELQTEVKIHTLYVAPDLSIFLEGVQLNDLEHQPMFNVGTLETRFFLNHFNTLRFGDVFLKDVYVNIVKYEGHSSLNVNEIFDKFKDENDTISEPLNLNLYVNSVILDNINFVYWDKNKDHPEKVDMMDYHHLAIQNVGGMIENIIMRNDSVMAEITSLSGKERCGIDLSYLSASKALYLPTEISLEDLNIAMNGSKVNLDFAMQFSSMDAFDTFEDSVTLIADIHQGSYYTLSDARFYAAVLNKMPDTLHLSGLFNGTVADFSFSNCDISFEKNTQFKGYVALKGLPDITKTVFDVDFTDVKYSFDDIAKFYVPSKAMTYQIPDVADGFDNGEMSLVFNGTCYDFDCDIDLMTQLGNVKGSIFVHNRGIGELSDYQANLNLDKLNLTSFVGTDEPFKVTTNADLKGTLTYDDITCALNADVKQLQFLGNNFHDFNVGAVYDDNQLFVNSAVDEPALQASFDGLIDMNSATPEFFINGDFKEIDLVRLHLLDQDTTIFLSGKINARYKGEDLESAVGHVNLGDFKYFGPEGFLTMDTLALSMTEREDNAKSLLINNDFFDFELDGILNFSTLGNSLKNYLNKFLFIPEWENVRFDDEVQDFYTVLNIHSVKPLTKMFLPQLKIADSTTFSGTFSSEKNLLHVNLESREVDYDGMEFKNIDLRHKTMFGHGISNLSIDEILLSDSTDSFGRIAFQNFTINSNMAGDSLKMNIDWNNKSQEINSGDINFSYGIASLEEAALRFDNSTLFINSEKWDIGKNGTIYFGENVYFDSLYFSSQNEIITIDGALPMRKIDTLSIGLENFDISVINQIFKEKNIAINGDITGKVDLSGLSEDLSFFTHLNIDTLSINNHVIGNTIVSSEWSPADTSMLISSTISRGNLRSLYLNGHYFMNRAKPLDFDVDFEEFNISFVNPFTRGIVSRLNGSLDGDVHFYGSIEEPVIKGKIRLENAGCNIDFLDTYYSFSHDIVFEEDLISIKEMILTDTIGNKAVLNANVNHKNLRDINFDVNLGMRDFLGMNIPSTRENAFYGTALADGFVSAKGTLKDISLRLNVTTKEGTDITIPLSSTSSVNDSFIIFVDRRVVKKDDDEDSEEVNKPIKRDYDNFNLDLTANVTPDAKVAILLPSNMGSIEAIGQGSVNLSMKNDDMSLVGDYTINSGNFVFSLQNIVKKTFNLREGGRLVWTGDPADADINAVGVYKTKSSLSSLGLALDSTANSNINVNCVIRLSGKLLNPTLNFGIELPNASSDMSNSVFAVIDTTNQGVMAQQVLSLLVLGQFVYTSGTSDNSWSRFGSTTYYGVITDQISHWLSQISNDFDIGVKYTPSDNITREELEVALSTQLFDDRLTIEGNFGMYTGNKNQTRQNANNVVGDFDLTWKLTNRLSLKAYNHSNVNRNYNTYSFDNYSEYTQGVGFSLSQSFDKIREIFIRQIK